MPVPSNVRYRRNISIVTGTTNIPDYPGLQGVVFLGTVGKPDLPTWTPPYPPNTSVPVGTKYLDVMDDGQEPLPVSPGAKYVCYLVASGAFVVDVDTFPNKGIRHNYAGWPNPTE